MLREHPDRHRLGKLRLLYPRCRLPTAAIGPDLVPTMVHSGPLQTAVSGGVPAVVLQILFLGIGTAVAGARAEADGRQRLLGAAFLAAGLAYLVQDLSGWPHVAWGRWPPCSADSRRLEPGKPPRSFGKPMALALLAAAIGAGPLDVVRHLAAHSGGRLMYEARRSACRVVDHRRAEGRSRARREPGQGVGQRRRGPALRAAAPGGGGPAGLRARRRARPRGARGDPFDPYIRCGAPSSISMRWVGPAHRRHRRGPRLLDAAKSMTPDNALVRKIETALLRRRPDPLDRAPASADSGRPAASSSPGPRPAPGRNARLPSWRDATRDTGWTTEAKPVQDAEGGWYNAIPNAEPQHRYEVYATCETWSYGPCAYTGTGAIQLCSPLALIAPGPAGTKPAGSLLVGGTAPDAAAAADLFLHWRNATRPSPWAIRPFRSSGAGEGISFAPDAPGNWYAVIPNARPGEKYQAYLASAPRSASPARIRGRAPDALFAHRRIQPQATAGFGPPEASSWPVPFRGSVRGLPCTSTGGTSRHDPRGRRKLSRRRPMPGATGPTRFRTPTSSPGTRSRSPHQRRPRTAAPMAGTELATFVPDRAQPLAAGSSFEVIW
jgi:hypothetical protein